MVVSLELGVLVYTWKSCSLTAGEAVALITLIGNAYTPVAIFNVLYVQYKLDKAAFARLEIFLMADEDRQLIEGHKIGKEPCDIEIRDLSFGYGARAVLEHLSLTVKGGQKTAFVGESGSGKSTLVKLLAGLLKYETGSIRVDGKELSSVCLSDYYEQLSYASQECPVFDGTVRENIVFDREAPRKKLEKILESVQLGTLLQNLPEGLETGIGEKGISLSGGERQRLAMARILFEQKSIIILDEATSAMDNLTESIVMGNVCKVLEGSTVIAATHRLETIKKSDKIVVFRQGTLAEKKVCKTFRIHTLYKCIKKAHLLRNFPVRGPADNNK